MTVNKIEESTKYDQEMFSTLKHLLLTKGVPQLTRSSVYDTASSLPAKNFKFIVWRRCLCMGLKQSIFIDKCKKQNMDVTERWLR